MMMIVLFHRLLTLKRDNLAFFQIMMLLLTTMELRSCTGTKYGLTRNYALCLNVCARSFGFCLKRCIQGQIKVCLKKLKKCNVKCEKTFIDHAMR